MRLNSIFKYALLEARDLLNSRALQPILHNIELEHGIKPKQSVELVNNVDPKNKFAKWILERILDGSFRGEEDVPRFKEAIEILERTNQSNRSRGISAIDIYKFRRISDLEDALDLSPKAKESGFIKDPTKLDKVRFLDTVKGLDVYAVSDPHSLGKMGLGTKWCTREDYEDGLANAKRYLSSQPEIYVLRKDGYPVIEASYDFNQFKDIQNHEMENADLMYAVAKKLGIFERTIGYILANTKPKSQVLELFKNNPSYQEEALKKTPQAIRGIINIHGAKASREMQLKAVSTDGSCIEDIIKIGIVPDEEIQLMAVKSNPYAIRHILANKIYTTEKVKLEAVKNQGYVIYYILNYLKNASEEIKIAAVSNSKYAIGDILLFCKTASEEVQLASVTKDGSTIREIIKAGISPSEEVQKQAILQDPSVITDILMNRLKLNKEFLIFAAKNKENAILYIINAGIALSEKEINEILLENPKSFPYMLAAGIEFSQEEIEKRIAESPSIITFIKNPSERVQLAAVQKNGLAIQYIKNPSENVQLAAVQQDGRAIGYIKNPSENVQLAAVQQDGYAIRFIENPSERIQLAAVQKSGSAIEYIENPSENVQLAAVQKDPWAIEYIKNPSENVQLAAVQKSGNAIRYIKNPSENVQLAAVQQYGYAIEYIRNPSERVQLAAVQQDGYSIFKIIEKGIKPSQSIVEQALEKNTWILDDLIKAEVEIGPAAQLKFLLLGPYYIGKLIDNNIFPNEDVQLEAVKQNPSIILELLDLSKTKLDLSEKVIIEAIKKEKSLAMSVLLKMNAKKITTQTREFIEISAVKSDAFNITIIENPSEAVQLAAIEKDIDIFYSIKNPTENVKIAAVSKKPSLIYLFSNPSEAVLDAARKAK